MKKILFVLFFLNAINTFSQIQNFLYKNDFDNPLVNDPMGINGSNSMSLKNGFLYDETAQDFNSWYVAQRIFIDFAKDYEIEMRAKPYSYDFNLGAEFGLIFGFKNVNMLHKLSVHTFGLVSIKSSILGVDLPFLDWTSMPKILTADNWFVFNITQKDKTLFFYVNGFLVFRKKQFDMLERWYGWYTKDRMGLQLDYFYVKQNRSDIKITKNANEFVKERITGGINTTKNETLPMLSQDGKSIYFKRIINEKNDFSFDDGEGVFYKSLIDSTLKAGNVLRLKSPLNSNQWYFSSIPNKKGYYSGEKYNFLALNSSAISFVNQINGTIDYNKNIYFSEKLSINVRHACISSDEKIMILSGWPNNEYAPNAMDLYVATKNGNAWTKPEKINSLNTKGDEITPFISKDMKHIYFSSDGHPGYGFSDVFVSERLDDSWKNFSVPENLGPKINDASYNEGFMMPDSGDFCYMASSHGYLTNLDIYRVRFKKIVEAPITLKGKIIYTDGALHAIKFVELEMQNKDEGIEKLIVENDLFITQLKKDQLFFVTLLDSNYIILEQSDLTSIGIKKERIVEIKVAKLNRGETFVLEKIYFSPNQFELLTTSYPCLNHLLTAMKSNVKLKIEIQGHTSNTTEGELFNIELSLKRAQAVKNYLINNGISELRIESKGYGYSNPITTEISEEKQASNRRVEVKILEK